MSWTSKGLGDGRTSHVDKFRDGYRVFGVESWTGDDGYRYARVVWAQDGSPAGSLFKGGRETLQNAMRLCELESEGKPLIPYDKCLSGISRPMTWNERGTVILDMVHGELTWPGNEQTSEAGTPNISTNSRRDIGPMASIQARGGPASFGPKADRPRDRSTGEAARFRPQKLTRTI